MTRRKNCSEVESEKLLALKCRRAILVVVAKMKTRRGGFDETSNLRLKASGCTIVLCFVHIINKADEKVLVSRKDQEFRINSMLNAESFFER